MGTTTTEQGATADDGALDAGRSLLTRLRSRIHDDPASRATYEDTVTRTALLDAGPAARRQHNLSQNDVATAMGTKQSAVSDLESGRVEPRLRTLQRYARAIGKRLDISIVDPSLPVFEQGAANELWSELEKTTLSPLLTVLATSTAEQDRGRRTLGALAESVYLPTPMVQPILTTLQEQGWATSAGSGDEQIYSLSDQAAYVVGVRVSKEDIAGALVDLTGDVIYDTCVAMPDGRQPSAVLALTVDVVMQLLAASDGHRVVGVGISIAGVVDKSSGRVEFAPDLQTRTLPWRGVELQRDLQAELDKRLQADSLRVTVENDANALAIREYLRRGDHSVVVLLLSGKGIGAGLVFDGRVAPGAHSAAGEGGHLVVDPSGPPCRAGLDHRGCLETMASAQAILSRLGIPADSEKEIEEGLIAANDRVRNHDEAATLAFRDAGRALGTFLAASVVLIDPARVVLYAHRPLCKKDDYASAEVFQAGVTLGLGPANSSSGGVADPARLEWHALDGLTGAKAAGAAALNRFLARPAKYAPMKLAAQINPRQDVLV